MTPRLLLVGPLAVALAVAPRSAAAQPTPGAVAAEALFREGRDLLARGQLAEACTKLEASEKLEPAVGTLFSLGECYEGQARLATAWFAYREAVTLAGRRDDRRRLAAQSRADTLEPRLAHVVIRVPGGAGPYAVRLDGEVVPPDAVGAPLPVDAGSHHVEATSTAAWSQTVNVPADGATVTVDVPSPPVRHEPVGRERLGLGLAVGGAAVLATGAVFGMQAIVKGRDVGAACPSTQCGDAGAVHENGVAKTYADASTVLLPVGAVLAAAGGYLLLTSHATLEPAVSPTTARLNLRWSW
ncbi:MAG TPA: hypothetical protein VGG39_36655 [Polyangiaceae bacterium]|jgi:hypothetical protein